MEMLTEKTKEEMIKTAFEMKEKAYCPYSKYHVGVGLLMSNGKIYGGCNIENSSYGACNCGERTAIFKAVSEGERKIIAIAICGSLEGATLTNTDKDYAFPCGICRQVIREFSNPKECKVMVCADPTRVKTYTLEQLLPESFGPEHLNI